MEAPGPVSWGPAPPGGEERPRMGGYSERVPASEIAEEWPDDSTCSKHTSEVP